MPDSLVRAIEQHLANAKEPLDEADGKPFAVFDFDNTCIVNDVGEATFVYLCGHKLLRDETLLGEVQGERGDYHERVFHTYHALLKGGKLKAAYMLIGRLFSGFTLGEAEAATLAAITEEGSRIGSKMLYGLHIERGIAARTQALALMEFLRKRGVRVWIISASAEPCVRAAMRHFGIEGELIGVRGVIKDGAFTQELEEPLSMFEGKAECIRQFIDPERPPLLAVGDSKSDLPMLEMADIKVVIEGRELTETARERGWFLL